MFVFVILLVGVVIWMAVTFRARQAVKECRWRENRSRDSAEGRYFLCTNCGAETRTADGKPPRACLKPPDPG